MTVISGNEDEEVEDKASLEADEPDHIISLQEFEEVMNVKKRKIPLGKIRVEKQVHERTQTVTGTLTHTTAGVKRVARNTIVDGEPPTTRQVGGMTIVPVLEERLVVRKELVLVEEIYLIVEELTEPFSKTETVRNEHIEITENINEEHSNGTTMKKDGM